MTTNLDFDWSTYLEMQVSIKVKGDQFTFLSWINNEALYYTRIWFSLKTQAEFSRYHHANMPNFDAKNVMYATLHAVDTQSYNNANIDENDANIIAAQTMRRASKNNRREPP